MAAPVKGDRLVGLLQLVGDACLEAEGLRRQAALGVLGGEPGEGPGRVVELLEVAVAPREAVEGPVGLLRRRAELQEPLEGGLGLGELPGAELEVAEGEEGGLVERVVGLVGLEEALGGLDGGVELSLVASAEGEGAERVGGDRRLRVLLDHGGVGRGGLFVLLRGQVGFGEAEGHPRDAVLEALGLEGCLEGGDGLLGLAELEQAVASGVGGAIGEGRLRRRRDHLVEGRERRGVVLGVEEAVAPVVDGAGLLEALGKALGEREEGLRRLGILSLLELGAADAQQRVVRIVARERVDRLLERCDGLVVGLRLQARLADLILRFRSDLGLRELRDHRGEGLGRRVIRLELKVCPAERVVDVGRQLVVGIALGELRIGGCGVLVAADLVERLGSAVQRAGSRGVLRVLPDQLDERGGALSVLALLEPRQPE